MLGAITESIPSYRIKHFASSIVGLQHRTVGQYRSVNVPPIVGSSQFRIKIGSYRLRVEISGFVRPLNKKATRERLQAADRRKNFRRRRGSSCHTDTGKQRQVKYDASHLQQSQRQQENASLAHCCSTTRFVL